MPLTRQEDITELIGRRHPEYLEHQKHWRFLADSLEGGARYKHADYYLNPNAVATFGKVPIEWFNNVGVDSATAEIYPIAYGQVVDRNLIPHLSETTPEGRDLYAMRLARTPVVPILERVIESHLSRVYSREVRRPDTNPPALADWWLDVDGKGSTVDQWMRETVAPLLLALGCLDIAFDHPALPEGAKVRSRADEAAYGVDRCVASVILPENVVWWRLDAAGARYAEILIVERLSGAVFYRHVDAGESNAYAPDGTFLPGLSRPNPFGRVPVVRLFDRRKVRCGNVGRSRYDGIAQYQKAFYNGLSELILSDVLQSSATLQGPEGLIGENSTIRSGAAGVLPMKKSATGDSYQGWSYVEPPKGAQQEIRTHLMDFLDWADRDAGIAKPAGQAGGKVTAQSGVSKVMDQIDGNALLADRAAVGENAELVIAEFALCVLNNGEIDEAELEAVSVLYPKQFDLDTAADVSQNLADIQTAAQNSGALPTVEGALIKKLAQLSQPGLPDDEQSAQNDEIDALMAASPSRPDPRADASLLASDGAQVAPQFQQGYTTVSD